MTFEQIKALIDIVVHKGLHELEVERSDFRVKIVGGAGRATVSALPVASEASSFVAQAVASSSGAGAATGVEAGPEAEAGHRITSPIVGTFYAGPSPDSGPYVQVGDRVSAGQVLCIVEAMKLMNEIESDVDGEVAQILPANAQPVEFGELLFVIRPDQ